MKKKHSHLFISVSIFLLLIPDLSAQFYESTIAGSTLAVDQFRSVGDVAVDAAGNIYALDPSSHQIKKFSSTGAPLLQWGSFGSADGQFNSPQGIDVDVDGNVFVLDTWNHRVQKFSNNGVFLAKWGSYGSGDGQFHGPHGIAIDAGGSVYVVDTNNNRIQKFSSAGVFLAKWGSLGSGDSQFNYPQGIAIDAGGGVYVVDSNNNRIQKFSSTGTFLAKWGSPGSGDSQFNYPRGIAIDASGNVYVSEVNNARIQKFSSSGSFLTKWGSYGSGNGLFISPQGIAFDVSGNVYVADSGNSRIQKFSNVGVFQSKWGNFGPDGQINYPFGVAIDATGNVYVTDTNYNRIQKYSNSGVFLAKWGSQGSGDGQFNSPQAIAVDASGNVFVLDTWNHRVQKFSNNGVFLAKWGSFGSGDGQFHGPHGIAIDAGGNVYVVDTNNNRVQKFSSAGVFLAKWGSQGTGDGQFSFPQGINIDLNGNIYVVDTNNNRIQKFSGTGIGNFIGKWGSVGSGDGQFNYPRGIAIDAIGNTYVADSNNNRVQQFSNIGIGTFLTKWGSYGSGNNQLIFPQGIAVGGGYIYVADANNHRIQKFSSLNITSLSSVSGLVDAAITINGTGFSSTAFENFVRFNGVAGSVTSASPTSLVVKVPIGATTGPITINRLGITSQSVGEFLVLPLAITAFSPGIGTVGSAITITGTGFSSVNANNLVKFNGVTANVTNSTSTSITAILPAGTTVGKVTVTVNGTPAISADDFGGALTVSSFSPTKGEIGAAITITGTGFSTIPSNQIIKFDNTVATITASTLTSLTVTVPSGASTGKVSVTRENTTAESATEFLVLPVTINSFSPSVAAVDALVTIAGTGFSSTKTNNLVKFNGIAATVISSNPTSITALVPAGATQGKIAVTVNDVTASSVSDFKVTKLIIGTSTYPEYYNVGDVGLSVAVSVNNIAEVGSAIFKSRGITASEATTKAENLIITTNSNAITYQVPASFFTDPLGLYSWFIITDKEGNEFITEPEHTFLLYSVANSEAIPSLKFGKAANNYNLISIPLNLTESSSTKVFQKLGTYDKRKWRLFEFTNGEVKEQPTLVLPGKGYWLIMANENEIKPGAGSTIKAKGNAPYLIKLVQGWNLIGNPYDFSISWTDVLEYNNLSVEQLKIRQFIDGAIVNDPFVKHYRGAFIYSDVARDIQIPIINRNSSLGRLAGRDKNSIDKENWVTSITLSDGEVRNELFGFGMNAEAKELMDVYDEPTLPLPEGMSSFDLKFREIGSEKLAIDIVTTSENYSWQAAIRADKDLTLSWDNSYFGSNGKRLVIENLNEIEIMDMRISNQLKLRPGNHVLKFHYGDFSYVDQQLIERSTRMGYVYPNPVPRAYGALSVNVSLPEGRNEVSFHLKDLLGNNLKSSKIWYFDGGRQVINWQANLDQLSAGIYLIRIQVKDSTGTTKQFNQRIILE